MPGITKQQLEDAARDAQHIADLATSGLPTATDRLGTTKKTMAGAIADIATITNRGNWAAATAYAIKDLVNNGGTWYLCIVGHTSSGAFATDEATKWRVYQPKDASFIEANDGSGGSLFTTVQGFISKLGVLFGTRTSAMKYMTTAQIADVQGYSGSLDHTSAIALAFADNKPVHFPAGMYVADEITLSRAGLVHSGEGYYHYGTNRGTIIKARTLGQNSVFKLANGADNVGLRDMRIDGDLKADHCIDGSFGAFFSLDNVGVYRSVLKAFKGRQGLARIRKVYSGGHAAVGFEVYSDATVTDSEFHGGTEPLRIVAGGNRLSNVWANGGSVSCVTLEPLDTSTNHINTSINGLYTGETLGGASEVPIIKIRGNVSRLVEQVQISNLHLVCAETAIDKINTGIDIDRAREITIGTATALGFETSTATRHLKHFIKASNINGLTVNGAVVKNCGKNPIVLNASCFNNNITGNTFTEYGTQVATGTEGAGILVSDNANYGVIANNIFDTSTASGVPYAMEGGNAARFVFANNMLRYSNSTIWNVGTGVFAGSYRRMGLGGAVFENISLKNSTVDSTNINQSKQNYQSRGQITAGASSTTTMVTLANVAENQTYLISVRQAGGVANNVMGYVVANGASCKAVRMAQDNTTGGALDMNLTVSGLSVQLVLGSGYGSTTWDWVLTRLG